MAKLLNFEQDPDAPHGYGLFHVEGENKPTYGYEPELATQIKSRIDSAPDERLARNDAPTPLKIGGIGGQLHAQGQQASADALGSLAPPPGPAPPPGAPMGPPSPGGPPLAPPPPDTQQASDAARAHLAQQAAEEIQRGTRRTFSAGTPGVDPEKLNAAGKFVHKDQKTVIEASGAPYDPEQAKARLDAAGNVLGANLDEIALNRQQTANQLATQRALAPKLQTAAADAQAKYDTLQANYHRDRASLQQDLDHYEKTAHVNPDKYFEDRGVFATMGLAIAQGMGAYASSVNGGPNFAFEMVQKGIDRDIAAQRSQIENGQVSRRNKLANMMDNYGYDLPQAEAALRIAMNKSAGNQAALFANESQLPHYQTTANSLIAMTTDQQVKAEQAFKNASIGKRTQTLDDTFTQPKAATHAGFVEKPLTDANREADVKFLNKPQATPGEDWEGMKPEQRQEAVTKYATQREGFAKSRSTMEALAHSYGLKVDWQKGEVVGKDGKPVNPDDYTVGGKADDIPGIGHFSLDRQGSHRVREERARAMAQEGKDLSGASVAKEQQEMIQSFLLGDDTDAGSIRGLQRAVTSINDIDREADKSAADEARQEYHRRSQVVNHSRKSAPAPVKVTPY